MDDDSNNNSPKLRRTLIAEMIKELRGPRKGIYEEIITDNPYKEYITGIAAPVDKTDLINNNTLNPDDEFGDKQYFGKLFNDSDEEDFDSSDSESGYSIPNELNPKNPISSFGISFFISNDKNWAEYGEPELKICVSWGRYSYIPDKKIWKRNPYYSIESIKPFSNNINPIEVYTENDGSVRLWVKTINDKSTNRVQVILTLENNLPRIKKEGMKIDEILSNCGLFQPSIRVILVNTKLLPKYAEPRTEIEYINQDNVPYARGYMCSAVWKDIDYNKEVDNAILWSEYPYIVEEKGREIAESFLNCDVRSEFLPLSAVPMPDFELDNLENMPELSVYNLSETWNIDDFRNKLQPWSCEYRKWIDNNKKSLSKSNEFTDSILIKEEKTLDRINKGINTLLKPENSDARLAFCFANRVIFQQRLWKTPELERNPGNFKWRPFQLAFFLSSLESLYNENSDDRNALDLLWVSTGGGKTEAYLSMMAFVMALRSIRATKDPSRKDGGAGVSIITRYTLRLLTIQQFRRTLLMVTAAEYLRVHLTNEKHGWRPESCDIETDWIYGKTKYSIGMLVGGNVTPNSLQDAINILKGNTKSNTFKTISGEPAQLLKCPVCGEWLSIPKTNSESGSGGIPPGSYDFHISVKIDGFDESKINPNPYIIEENDITVCWSVSRGVFDSEKNPDNWIIIIHWKSNISPVTQEKFDDIVTNKILNEINAKVTSFTSHNMGYFPKYDSFRKNRAVKDFVIYCPNPKCSLNSGHIWEEENPIQETENYDNNPFITAKCIPIPAYTVDEQIYKRCPTILISTADKIARFAFETRSGVLLGGVKYYCKGHGYSRFADDGEESIPISLQPPDLIVQDELHLLEGPLGSLFGLYELMIRSLIYTSGGKPKYIASSATVTNAEKQIHKLFNLDTHQFPPYGIKSNDSFFVKMSEATWNEDKPGRVYMGIYGPGKGSLTPAIRIWSNLLKTTNDYKNNYGCNENNHVNNFWTIVGYCNSMRELGGLGAIYQSDIIERLNRISSEGSVRDISTNITAKSEELSSRKSSTIIPQILEMLESEKNNVYDPTKTHDNILTTSMFGTGVDIPHLSLMVINGQPKTTAQYIQASGRVGRDVGALIPVLFKPGRARDLSHYEMFTSYHNALNLFVEQTSVSPFSTGCLERALGPVAVSYLRNLKESNVDWSKDNGGIIKYKEADVDIENLQLVFEKMTDNVDSEDTNNSLKRLKIYLESFLQRWKYLAANESKSELPFSEVIIKRDQEPVHDVVLGDYSHPEYPRKGNGSTNCWSVFKNAPQALRDVEETIEFGV